MLAHVRGELQVAAQQLQRALELARARQAHWEEAECLLELGWLELERGAWQRVLEHAAALVQVAAQLDEGAYTAAAHSQMALASLTRDAGSNFDAFEHSAQALRAADANRLLAIALNRAARLAFSGDVDERASRYAEQALAAAGIVERAIARVRQQITQMEG